MTIQEYLTKLCDYCGADSENIGINVDEKQTEDGSPGRVEISLDIPEDEVSLFIGSRGETLESIEQMVKIIFHEEYPEQRIILDINGYKKAKEDRLKEKAVQMAVEVLETGRSYVFPYLNSYERFMVHSAISEDEELGDIETFSEDEENTRVLVIQLKEGCETKTLDRAVEDEVMDQEEVTEGDSEIGTEDDVNDSTKTEIVENE